MQKIHLNILIADDDPLMRQLLSNYLENVCQHAIIKAIDGKEALNLYKKFAKKINMIFLDIMMPKIGGLEVLQEIREINPDAYIVILSGANTLENVRTAIASGVNGFIVKPYTNIKIDEALKNYLRLKKTQING